MCVYTLYIETLKRYLSEWRITCFKSCLQPLNRSRGASTAGLGWTMKHASSTSSSVLAAQQRVEECVKRSHAWANQLWFTSCLLWCSGALEALVKLLNICANVCRSTYIHVLRNAFLNQNHCFCVRFAEVFMSFYVQTHKNSFSKQCKRAQVRLQEVMKVKGKTWNSSFI